MKHGTGPIALDPRDFSHHQTFGSATPPKWPSELILDKSGIFPDQNADGFPYGCTGYTQADNASNRDGIQYKPVYTYEKTCYMEGHADDQGCQIRTSLKSTRVYGTQAITEETDQEAETHRGGAYFNVYDDGGLDWFDSARQALLTHNVPLSVGSPWFKEWENPYPILSSFYYDRDPSHYAWHNFAIKGWKQVNGEPALMVKSWQGRTGDNGWQYLPRSVFNSLMQIPGAAMYYQLAYTPADVNSIKLDLLQTVLLFIGRLINAMSFGFINYPKPLN